MSNRCNRKKNIGKEDAGLVGRVRIVTRKAGTDEILRTTEWKRNLIMLGSNTGKSIILNQLNGVTTIPLSLTYADMGTGTNTPATSDTTLQTAVARGQKATGSVTDNVLTLQYFFPDGDLPDGTYTEFGTFANGTATISTGNIFNRILFGSSYVKSAGEDTTVELELTIT